MRKTVIALGKGFRFLLINKHGTKSMWWCWCVVINQCKKTNKQTNKQT